MAESSANKRLLPAAAIVAAVIGIVATAIVSVRVMDRWKKIRQYADYSSRLADMERVAERGNDAVNLFREIPNPKPVSLADLLKETFPDQKYDSTEQPQRETTIPGWSLRQVEVSFPEIELTRLAVFMEKAESQRPPWRMESCTIRAVSQSGGIGYAKLVFNALEKSE